MKKKINPNQLLLFDFMKVDDQKENQNYFPEEPDILYVEGDRLFHQRKGDVLSCIVTGEISWIVHNNRFYRVKYDSGIYGIVSNESKDFFREEQDATAAAENWLLGKDVIRKENIHFEKAEIYEEVRAIDQKVIHAILLPLDGGLLYLKTPSLYTHIVQDNKKNRKDFYERTKGFMQIDIDDATDSWDLEPENMYRCQGVSNAETEWLYASYGYRMAMG